MDIANMQKAIGPLTMVAKKGFELGGVVATIDGITSQTGRVLDWCGPMFKTQKWAEDLSDEMERLFEGMEIQWRALCLPSFHEAIDSLDRKEDREGVVDIFDRVHRQMRRCKSDVRLIRKLLRQMRYDDRERWNINRLKDTHKSQKKLEELRERLIIDAQKMESACKTLDHSINRLTYLELREKRLDNARDSSKLLAARMGDMSLNSPRKSPEYIEDADVEAVGSPLSSKYEEGSRDLDDAPSSRRSPRRYEEHREELYVTKPKRSSKYYDDDRDADYSNRPRRSSRYYDDQDVGYSSKSARSPKYYDTDAPRRSKSTRQYEVDNDDDRRRDRY